MLPQELRDLPYLVHTNRELGLMLHGVKPMAIFGDVPELMPDFKERYLRMFDRHVGTGRFTKRVYVVKLDRPHLRYKELHQIYYTLPDEEWRVEAIRNLLAQPGPWSNERERKYGELLGYSDWENDVWLERFPYKPET